MNFIMGVDRLNLYMEREEHFNDTRISNTSDHENFRRQPPMFHSL